MPTASQHTSLEPLSRTSRDLRRLLSRPAPAMLRTVAPDLAAALPLLVEYLRESEVNAERLRVLELRNLGATRPEAATA